MLQPSKFIMAEDAFRSPCFLIKRFCHNAQAFKLPCDDKQYPTVGEISYRFISHILRALYFEIALMR